VPNFSFEQYDTCPDHEGQIERALGWLNFGGTLQGPATPDYYNACNSGNYNVPNGGQAHQSAASGQAFSAIATFYPNVYREYIGIELSQALIIGQQYFISFQTCMGEALGVGCPSNKLGIRLSTLSYSLAQPLLPDNFAHVFTDSIINDSINWQTVKGSIIADSAYNYLIIGNFYDNNHTDTIQFNSNSYASYYLVDDVCLSTDSVLCAGITSIKSIETFSIEVFPNPVSDYLTLKFPKLENAEIVIYDVCGQILFKGKMNNESGKIVDVSFLSQGYYFLRVNLKTDGKSIIKKIIKI
jgi:hypothetical protein